MVFVTVNLPKEADIIIEEYQKQWGLNKHDTLIRIIKEYVKPIKVKD